MVKHLKDKSEFENAIKSTQLVVVDFFAEWCGPCKYLAPLIDDYAKKYTNVFFYKVDVDELSEVAEEQGISAMPTIKFYKNGSLLTEVVGADAKKIEDTVIAHSK